MTHVLRKYVRGSSDYITATVSAPVELTTQAVAISLDRQATWITAVWLGDAGTTRQCGVIPTTEQLPAVGVKAVPVFVRITTPTEVPVIEAGVLTFG